MRYGYLRAVADSLSPIGPPVQPVWEDLETTKQRALRQPEDLASRAQHLGRDARKRRSANGSPALSTRLCGRAPSKPIFTRGER